MQAAIHMLLVSWPRGRLVPNVDLLAVVDQPVCLLVACGRLRVDGVN